MRREKEGRRRRRERINAVSEFDKEGGEEGGGRKMVKGAILVVVNLCESICIFGNKRASILIGSFLKCARMAPIV